MTKDDVVTFVRRCVEDGAGLLAAKGDTGLNKDVKEGSPQFVRLVDLAYRVIEHFGEP